VPAALVGTVNYDNYSYNAANGIYGHIVKDGLAEAGQGHQLGHAKLGSTEGLTLTTDCTDSDIT
jgi:hypothetical protein